jgi:ribokinase
MAKHVLVAGSLHHDLVVNAEKFPVVDEYLPGHSLRYLPGGKGGNQAVASVRNGVVTWFAGRVGDDEAGRIMAANLKAAGVDISMLQVGAGEASGASVAIVNPFGDFGAIVVSGANLSFDAGAITIPPETGYLVLQNELPADANIVLARKAKEAGALVMLNDCPVRRAQEELLYLSDILVLGQTEGETMAGRSFSSPKIALEAIVPMADTVPRVAIMLGAGGLVHMERGGRPEYHPAMKGKPESMHGAMDFFVGALASQMASGSEFEAAVHYGQAAASVFMSTPVERRDLIRATQVRARLGEDDR